MTSESTSRTTISAVTVFFADMSGSTAMYASRGDEAAYRVASRCLGLMEEAVRAAGGRVIKRVGDGILALFDGVEEAVAAATDAVRRVRDDATGAETTHVRVGIDHGEAVVEPADVYGDVVNVAARLVDRARPDEILLSERARDALPAGMRRRTRFLDDVAVRGRFAEVGVHQYVGTEPNLTVPVPGASATIVPVLELRWAGHSLVIGPERPSCTIGRSPERDVPIDDRAVSRHHAEITLRGDKFVLADWSTNGTHVHPAHTEPVRLLREELVLVDEGAIRVGASDGATISYRVRTP